MICQHVCQRRLLPAVAREVVKKREKIIEDIPPGSLPVDKHLSEQIALVVNTSKALFMVFTEKCFSKIGLTLIVGESYWHCLPCWPRLPPLRRHTHTDSQILLHTHTHSHIIIYARTLSHTSQDISEPISPVVLMHQGHVWSSRGEGRKIEYSSLMAGKGCTSFSRYSFIKW